MTTTTLPNPGTHRSPFRIVLIVLALALASTACGSSASDVADTSNADATDSSATTDPTTDTEIPAVETTSPPGAQVELPQAPELADGLLAPPSRVTSWTGMIGDDIEVSVWLAQSGDFIRGEISYGGAPITLLGRKYPAGGYFLHEFGPDGNVSGTLILPTVTNDSIVGTWDDLPLTLELTDVGTTPFFFDPLVRPGNYVYGFGPFEGDDPCCGPRGLLQISNVTESTVTIRFDNTTSGPAYNLASIYTIEIPLEKNVARFDLINSIHPNCAFDITIFDGFAFVQYVDDRFECGFGNAASVEGIYVLDETATVAASTPLGNEVLTTTSFGELELGQSWRSLTERYGVPAFDPSSHPFPNCYYVELPDVPNSPWLMLLGDENDAVISRIEPIDHKQQTSAKVGFGSTEAEVLAAHDNNITQTPHLYLGEGAKYLLVNSAPGEASTLMYVTNEQGIVEEIRNGYLGPIEWVEGCL